MFNVRKLSLVASGVSSDSLSSFYSIITGSTGYKTLYSLGYSVIGSLILEYISTVLCD